MKSLTTHPIQRHLKFESPGMKKAIKEIIECALDKAKDAGELELGDAPNIVVEKKPRTKK